MAQKNSKKTTKKPYVAPKIEYIEKKDALMQREKKSVLVDRELGKIHKEHGVVTPQLMIESARNAKHPLHRYFEWDDSVAAQKFRLAQAQSLIMGSKYVAVLNSKATDPVNDQLVISAHQVQVRKYLPIARGAGQKTREEVLGEEDSRARLVEQKIGVLKGWCRSVSDIGELDRVRIGIERLVQEATHPIAAE